MGIAFETQDTLEDDRLTVAIDAISCYVSYMLTVMATPQLKQAFPRWIKVYNTQVC
ncbi:MAG: hypothetical protein ICV63_15935 [Coleofasciculus sp. Co-bin14]|nr:hypothetical protein [Coleofasciculus sp. Co-bin14]